MLAFDRSFCSSTEMALRDCLEFQNPYNARRVNFVLELNGIFL